MMLSYFWFSSMIEYDYVLRRNDEDEKKTFGPSLPKKLPNLTYIEGPNSSGKSTLLHILGLAFHGHELTSIPPSLRDKMRNLIESNHQDLTFEVTIEMDDQTITATKPNAKSKDITVYRVDANGKRKTIATNQLKKEFNLIYDIPESDRAHREFVGRSGAYPNECQKQNTRICNPP